MGVHPVWVPLGLMVCYLGLAGYVLVKRPSKSKAVRYLLVFCFASAAWNASFAVSLAFPQNTVLTEMSAHAALGGLAILAVVYLSLTHAFLHQESRYATAWWVLGIVSLIIVVVLDPQVGDLGMTPVHVGQLTVGQSEIVQLFSVLAWGGFKLAAILATGRVFRETVSIMHRNRLRYWLLSVALLMVGDLLFATNQSTLRLLGGLVHLAGALVGSMVIVRSRLVDIKGVYRRAFGYVGVTLFMIAVNLGITALAFQIWVDQVIYAALVSVGAISILFAFVASPVRRSIQRFVDRRFFHETVDYERALRKYGDRVITRLKLDSLAELVMETLLSTMRANRGGLYLIVDGKRDIGGLGLSQIQRQGDLPAGDFELRPDSQLGAWLKDEEAPPLTQYEIDTQEHLELHPDERNWLRALMVEVLLPIHARNQLVGLIVLGAKGSGEAYAAADIDWLESFSAQTSVALENAQLFDQVESMSVNVMRLNADLEHAYHQLQEVDRLKSAFIGVITHELRSPFVAAGLSVELIHRYLQEGMTDDLQEQVSQLAKELGQGRSMIDSVISFASLLSKQGKPRLEPTDIAALLQTTLSPMETMARSRNIAFSCMCSARFAPIHVDPARLGEAMYHLVHNAIKFNAPGGSVQISCWPTDTHVVFRVEDTGEGIAPENLAGIWDGFAQGADDVQRGVEGLGLGLALVKFVVEAHRGEVWASSTPGQGSTFGFRIPNDLDPVAGPDLAMEAAT